MTKKISLTSAMLQNNARVYREYERLYMDNGWYSGNQLENFTIMSKIAMYANVSFAHASCLDVGCGSGDLWPYVKDKGLTSYIGIDIYLPAIEKAKQKHPTAIFLFADILTDTTVTTYDFVFCSGALTTKYAHIDQYEFITKMIEAMWQKTKKGLVFNFLTDEEDGYEDPDLFCYNNKKVLAICRSLAPSAHIVSEPTPNRAQSHIFMWR